MFKYILFFILISLQISCKKNYLFTEVSANYSGVNFVNEVKEKGKANILDYLYFFNGAGVAVGDINNDNLPDIYFVSNQGENKLFLNKGNFTFQDISKQAHIEGISSWDTGVVMADVNNDGWLDIYVSSMVGIHDFTGYNQLFINQKNNTFKEESEKYGLNFKTYAAQAAFFDFDKDGDLDMYLLNQNIHNPYSFGPSELRNRKNESSGDKLLRNDNEKFIDISESAGIYGGEISYGLGLSIADFNQDGWDDIYVGNDFHEDDYLYINQKNGTFKDERKSRLSTTSKFSMGNDAADINHDGFTDIITVDMLPQEEKFLKITPTEDDFEIQKLKTELGYLPQQMRNCLQLNQQGIQFNEVGELYGITATDWSWGPLFADFDLDGNTDLFVATGIAKRPNDLDFIKYISNDKIRSQLSINGKIDAEVINKMASGSVPNYIFSGDSLRFNNKSNEWIENKNIISNGAVYCDLDNDGDLDLILNNYNLTASLYKNTTTTKNYLKIKFNYFPKNKFGIGTKVYAYAKRKLYYQELQTTRGFQSAVEPIIHLGLGNCKELDSLKVIWNDDTYEVFKNIKTNRTLLLLPSKNRERYNYPTSPILKPNRAQGLGLSVKSIENEYNDFNREKLIPYKISEEGPALAIADINKDGTEDVFIGGVKNEPSKLFIQKEGKFVQVMVPDFKKDRICEDVDAVFFDIDNDSDLDLLIISGGGEFYRKTDPLLNRIYMNNGKGQFTKDSLRLPKTYENNSIARICDYDSDGDLDVFFGGRAVSNQFGRIPNSYLLLNNGKGNFTIQPNEPLQKVGMVKDALWTDLNADNKPDLIVVGEWFSPKFFINKNNTLVEETGNYITQNISGLWQSIQKFDIDYDGDFDYLLGNFGLNTRFYASNSTPLELYFSDFDANGKTESLLSMYHNNNYYPINSKDELTAQMVSLIGKKYVYYKDFAGQTTTDIFPKNILNKAQKLEINTLASGYLKNDKGKFTFIPFINSLQTSPIKNFLFLKDYKAVLSIGNAVNISPYLGNINSDSGSLIFSNKKVDSSIAYGFNFFNEQINKIKTIKINNTNYIISLPTNKNIQIYPIR